MFETSGITSAAFWALSALILLAGVAVVTLRNIFRAALALAICFLSISGLYFLLSAEFIGVVQILVYVGAISVLVVFAVMLVRDIDIAGKVTRWEPALLVAGVVSVLLLFLAYNIDWRKIENLRNPDAAAALGGTYVEEPLTQQVYSDFPQLKGEAVVKAAEPGADGARPGVFADPTGPIGALLIREYLLAFQVIGIVLTATLIGALALLRERKAL